MKEQYPTQLDRQARDLFLHAVEMQSPEARAGYFEGACRHDPALRARVDALLQAHAKDSFLEDAVTDAIATRVTSAVIRETQGTLIDRYKLLEKLGEGGFGAVWAAEQKEPVRRKVALKIIKLGMDTKQVVARFEAERQALALMDHPNIAKVLDAGTTDTGRPYFVMELVRGIPITKFCDENRMPANDRLDLFIKTCQAVQHAHQKGIIHRDIKPSNILVTLHDGVPVPKVIDFGIAKATHGELTNKTIHTQFQQFIGTPAYMSPEQAEMSGLDIDTRSDIYSLGVLLYELLTGKTPLEGRELVASGLDEMRRTIREKEPLRPSTRLATLENGELTTAAKRRSTDAPKLIHLLRGDLDWIVMKCLEKDRTRRYETANGLATDLKRYLGNEPVLARPPSAAYRLQKAFRRNKLIFGAGAAVAASLVIGLCVSTWSFINEAQARREAISAKNEQSKLRQVAEKALEGEREQRRKADKSAVDLSDNLYASEMSTAFAALWAGSVQRSRELLARQSQSNRADGRGFEWRWLWGQTRPAEQFVLAGNEADPVYAVDFSPDGRRFLTLSDTSLKIWDARTHELLRSVSHGFGYHAEFSPDGRFIVSSQYDFGVRLLDANTGVVVTNFLGHRQGTCWVTFSPDSRLLASVDTRGYSKQDAEIFLWDVASHQRVAVLAAAGSEWIMGIKFSPDGQTLAAACGNGQVLLFDVPTRRIINRLTGHRDSVICVCFTPDGKRLVSGGFDRTVRLWNLAEGKEISLLGLHEKGAMACAISPDGRLAATTGLDHMVKFWNLDQSELIRTLRGHEARPWGIAFHPDGTTLLTSGADGTVRFWNVPEKSSEWVLDGVWADCFGFGSKNRLLLGLLRDEHIEVWDVAVKKRLLHVPGDNAVWVPGSERIVFHRGRHLMELDVPSESERVLGDAGESDKDLLASSSDGRLLAWGHGDHAHVFNRESGAEVARLNTGDRRAQQIAFSPNGATLATAGDGSQAIQLWDAATWKKLKALEGHRKKIKAIMFSPDGRELASVSDDHTTRLWRLETTENVILQDDEGVPEKLAFSADGRTLAVGTFESSIKLWSVRTRQQITSLEAGRSFILSVNFSPDGKALAATTFDGKVRVWQAPSWEEISQAEAKQDRKLSGP